MATRGRTWTGSPLRRFEAASYRLPSRTATHFPYRTWNKEEEEALIALARRILRQAGCCIP
jgi:hypothetical protein